MQDDLIAALSRLRSGECQAAEIMERAIAAAQSNACRHAFLAPAFEQARTESARAAGLPLAGLPVSIKDLFDIAGQPTRAGSVALDQGAPATQDAPAVARLRAAGAALIGRTNMTEFAYSGVGINPHYGTPANAAATDVARIPGGSSSGAAVSVAAGAAFVGLGSDTGGSIRIPAALNGIVGFKSTARLVPTAGALPLSTTMDTVCAMTRSVRDALYVHEILAARRVTRSDAPLSSYRLAVCTTLMFNDIEPTVARAWEASLARLRAAGAHIEDMAAPELDELAAMLATGGFSAAESYAWHRKLLQQHAERYDPRVRARIERGAAMSAADYIDLQHARADWIARLQTRIAGFDAVLSPTVPIVAPPIADLAPGQANDAAFFKVNGLLLRNTTAINMFDGCAISLPCHENGQLPVGLMLWHGQMQDDAILNIALQIERLLARQ